MKVTQSCVVHEILQARILEWVTFPFSRGSSQPRDWTQVSHIWSRFFTSWAMREAQEYWSSLARFQWIFPTQESNWGLLHCRWILHQLSYQGSPKCEVKVKAAQSCPTLCDPMDYAVHRILQARTLELGAFPFSRESSQPRDWMQVSHSYLAGFLSKKKGHTA